jgi:hypothetical protein
MEGRAQGSARHNDIRRRVGGDPSGDEVGDEEKSASAIKE